jgi:hypothetical protein
MSDLVVGKGIPGYALRVLILVTGAAMILVPLTEDVTFGTLVLLVPTVLASAYAPSSPAPAGAVIIVGVLVALADGPALRPEVLVLVPVVHLFHVACGIAGVLPAAGRLHRSALVAPAVRFLLVQAAVFAFVLVAALMPAGRTVAVIEVAALAAVAALAVLVVRRQRVK